MYMHGFRVTRENDDTYKITDAREIVLGHAVRWTQPDGQKRFRSFGEDFTSLEAAVAEHGKIRGAKPFPLTGDAFEIPTSEKTLKG